MSTCCDFNSFLSVVSFSIFFSCKTFLMLKLLIYSKKVQRCLGAGNLRSYVEVRCARELQFYPEGVPEGIIPNPIIFPCFVKGCGPQQFDLRKRPGEPLDDSAGLIFNPCEKLSGLQARFKWGDSTGIY